MFNSIPLLALLMIASSCYSMEINSLVYDGANESPIGWLADLSLVVSFFWFWLKINGPPPPSPLPYVFYDKKYQFP